MERLLAFSLLLKIIQALFLSRQADHLEPITLRLDVIPSSSVSVGYESGVACGFDARSDTFLSSSFPTETQQGRRGQMLILRHEASNEHQRHLRSKVTRSAAATF